MIWVEHVMKAVLSLAERIVVLNFGRLLADGAPHDVMRDPEVVTAYLGERQGVGGDGARRSLTCRPATSARTSSTAPRFTVAEGEAVAVIGSNGAGKTTLFRAVCGLLRAVARRGALRRRSRSPVGGRTASPASGSPTYQPSAICSRR